MKRILSCLLILALLLSFAACGQKDTEIPEDDPDGYSDKDHSDDAADGDDNDSDNTDNSGSDTESAVDKIIASAGAEAVTFEIVSNDGVTAKIVAQIPNYTELLTNAMASSDPESHFANAVSNKDYTTVEYTGYADIATSPEGKETILTDTVIEDFIEKELIKAINAVYEAEKGGAAE